MAAMGQELGVDNDWHKSYNQSHIKQQENGALSFETVSETPILDETITIVKEKVWSFRTALKGMAEALVHFGLSPAVVGYSYPSQGTCQCFGYITSHHGRQYLGTPTLTVPLSENECLVERDEGEAALRQVIDNEILARAPFTGETEDTVRQCRVNEERSLLRHDEDVDDSNHAFLEAGRKEREEMKSLTGRWIGELDEEDDEVSLKKDL